MSDTPITDLRAYDVIYRDDIGCIITATDIEQRADGEHVDSDFARTLERENATMREAIRVAEQLLLAVDDGAQQDINGSNWYDARQKFISKLQPFLKP